ncbi:MAG: cobalt ECF transporter T component CbiQ [Bacillota bacterium]
MGGQGKVPEWLLAQQPNSMCPCSPIGRRGKVGFLEKTLAEVFGFIRENFFSEELAAQDNFLQRVDPRSKMFGTILMIGLIGLLRHIPVLVVVNLWVLWVAYLSRIPLSFFTRRVWLVVPLFTGVMVIPALFNVFRPGDPLLVLIDFGHPVRLLFWDIPEQITMTRQGLTGAVLLILRVGASVSLVVLLTLTTRWHMLLKALAVLRVPNIFLMVLEMTYRYIFVLLNVTIDMFTARKSRTVGRIPGREQRRFISGVVGNIFGKAYSLSEEVHQAMLSRGYTGEPKILAPLKWRAIDWLWLGLTVLAGCFFYGGDKILGA